MLKNVIVDIAHAKVSTQPDEMLVTYSLGSCIGVSVYDPVRRCGGLLHFQLPTSSLDAARARANPWMFADTGVARLLEQVVGLGAEPRRLRVHLAGGAEILNDATMFTIGKRNHAAIRKILWQKGLLLAGEAVGGTEPRTMYVHLADGVVEIKNRGQTVSL